MDKSDTSRNIFKKAMWFVRGVAAVSIIGLFDAGYLTIEHFRGGLPGCSSSIFNTDCGAVLGSSYATVGPVPLALLGVLFYAAVFILTLTIFQTRDRRLIPLLFLISISGILASSYFVYLQLFVIKAICIFCMVSAVMTLVIFILALGAFGSLKRNI